MSHRPISELSKGSDRWRSKAIMYARTLKLLNHEKILETFPPRDLMLGLVDEEKKRAEIITSCTGTRTMLALSYSVDTGTAQLQQALTTGATTADEIFSVVSIDDLVRTQDPKRIWNLIYGFDWTNSEPENKRYMAHLLKDAIVEKLCGEPPLTEAGIVRAIGPEPFAADGIPLKLRSRMLSIAFEKILTASELLEIVPPDAITEYIPLYVSARFLEEIALAQNWMEPGTNGESQQNSDPEIEIVDASDVSLLEENPRPKSVPPPLPARPL